MKITNELGLPEPLVDAVKNDGYTKGDADFSDRSDRSTLPEKTDGGSR